MATPVPVDPATQRAQDEKHLRYLSMAVYVFCALIVLGSIFFGLMLLLGGAAALSDANLGGEDAAAAGAVGLVGGLLLMAFPLAIALLQFFFARSLQQHRRYTFCFVMAVLSCFSVPIGTIIGIFTIIVLMRPSVKQLFEQTSAAVPQTVS